jgi:hypothetical protein
MGRLCHPCPAYARVGMFLRLQKQALASVMNALHPGPKPHALRDSLGQDGVVCPWPLV